MRTLTASDAAKAVVRRNTQEGQRKGNFGFFEELFSDDFVDHTTQPGTWSPLSKGVLTGKYHGHGSSESGRMSAEMMKQFMPEEQRTARIVTAVKAVADETGRSMAQVALAWLRSRPVPVIPIIGARKLSQLQDNLASIDLSLSAEQFKTLNEASRIELGFPHEFYDKEMVRSLIYGGMADQIVV